MLFGATVGVSALEPDDASIATLVAAASMAATPVLFALSERFVVPRLQANQSPDYDSIEAADAPVIICGFGRFGQIIGRVLRMRGISFTALERDLGQVVVVRRFGNKVDFGDPTRADLLRAAGAEQAKLLIVTLDKMEDVLRVVEVSHRHFPQMKVMARARNRRHAYLLIDRAAEGLVRETFHFSLKMAGDALVALAFRPMTRPDRWHCSEITMNSSLFKAPSRQLKS